MKRCPFCAEDIQDAAIVCRYCHRDLPAASPISVQPPGPDARKNRTGLWMVGGLIGVAIIMLLPSLPKSKSAGGKCLLDAAAVPAPSFSAAIERGDKTVHVVAVRNRGSSPWNDVILTIRGLGANGTSTAGKPTGPHSLRVGYIDGGDVVAKNVADFTNKDGANWIPLMMEPTEVTITANVDGQVCSFEQQFDSSERPGSR